MWAESLSPAATRALGRRLGRALRPGDCVALVGEVGAGKTTFAQGVLAGAGAPGPARSPTYALVHEHRGRLRVRHMDAYRLDDARGWESVGGAELFEDEAATIVEWPDRIGPYLPADHLRIEFIAPPGRPRARLLQISTGGPRSERLAAAVAGTGPVRAAARPRGNPEVRGRR